MSDPSFANVSLLLHMDGADASTTFTDSSSNAVTVTAVGNAQIDTAQSKFGGASGLFDGTGDYLTAPASANYALAAGSKIFTVECWARPTGANDMIVFAKGGATVTWATGNLEWLVYVNPSSQLEIQIRNSASTPATYNGGAVSLAGVWQHLAVCSDGTDVRGFIDGALVFTGSMSAVYSSVASPSLEIGRLGSAGLGYAGHLDDLRITKGVARYTAAFTPPIAAFPDTAVSGPTIDTQPSSTTVVEASAAAFSVVASGTGTLLYQWQVDTGGGFADIGGETSSSLSFTAQVVDSGNTYRVAVTDDNGSTTSDSATLTVTPLFADLLVVSQPGAVAADAGGTAQFSVGVTGTSPFQYQWYGPQGLIPGQTARTLVVNAHPALNGNFYCQITDASGQSVTSDNAALTVTVQPPVILIQPTDQSETPNTIAHFEVSASGFGGLTYTWYADAAALPATGRNLAVTNGVDGTEFYVIVADDYGNSVQSSTVTLSINRVAMDDQTDPRTPSTVPEATRPRYKVTDWAGMVRAAEGKQPRYEPDYEFSGRTFKRRIT